MDDWGFLAEEPSAFGPPLLSILVEVRNPNPAIARTLRIHFEGFNHLAVRWKSSQELSKESTSNVEVQRDPWAHPKERTSKRDHKGEHPKERPSIRENIQKRDHKGAHPKTPNESALTNQSDAHATNLLIKRYQVRGDAQPTGPTVYSVNFLLADRPLRLPAAGVLMLVNSPVWVLLLEFRCLSAGFNFPLSLLTVKNLELRAMTPSYDSKLESQVRAPRASFGSVVLTLERCNCKLLVAPVCIAPI